MSSHFLKKSLNESFLLFPMDEGNSNKGKDPPSHHFPTGIGSYPFTNLSPTLILDLC